MNVTLVMVQADGTSREAPLKSLPAVIGRDEGVRVRIPKPNVSRRHCELAVNDDDELVVRDLKSSNGTYVNGERISEERELVPGDLLTVGEVVFVVRIDGHPKDIDAADSYAAGSVMLGGTPIEGTPTGPKTQMISGVPSWGEGQGGGGDGGGKQAAPAGAAPAKPAPAKKPSDDDDDDDFSDLLEGLDLGDDDDDDVPMKKQ